MQIFRIQTAGPNRPQSTGFVSRWRGGRLPTTVVKQDRQVADMVWTSMVAAFITYVAYSIYEMHHLRKSPGVNVEFKVRAMAQNWYNRCEHRHSRVCTPSVSLAIARCHSALVAIRPGTPTCPTWYQYLVLSGLFDGPSTRVTRCFVTNVYIRGTNRDSAIMGCWLNSLSTIG